MNRGGFSWKRFLGISHAKSQISKTIGIPLTKSGRQRKIGRMVTGGGCLTSITILTVIVICIFLAFSLVASNSSAQDTSIPQTITTNSGEKSDQASTTPPSLASILTQSIVFIYEDRTPENSSIFIPGKVLGTAFIVGIPKPGQPDKAFPFIVTAKHVIADKSKILVRFTLKSGSDTGFAQYNLSELRKNNDVWEYPNDEGVDIIVFRTLFYHSTKTIMFPIDLIASKETFTKENIDVLDRVSIPCLMGNYPGIKQNYPIALTTEEPIPLTWELGKRKIDTSQEVIFINSILNEGFSGAPVFLWPGIRSTPKGHTIGGKPWLIGIVHGFFPGMRRVIDEERDDVIILKQVPGVLGKSMPQKKLRVYSQENPGIGIIFPSWRLLDILHQDGVKKRIQEITDKENAKERKQD
jgi:hypothetical protein